MEKACTSCNLVKPLDEFFKQHDMVDGHRNQCKVCRATYKREQRRRKPEPHRISTKKWKKNNKVKIRAMSSKRRAALINRIPQWADLKLIEQFYSSCPEGSHVDHIIPLRGKNVSGLHVMENLQYLSKEENLRKYNKFEVR